MTLLLSLSQPIWQSSCSAMEQPKNTCPYKESAHCFEIITHYKAVYTKTEELLNQGVDPSDILILTDWDDTINGANHEPQGAWSFNTHEKTSVRTEEDVDHQLRDLNTPEILANIGARGVKILVTTARPPIRDLDAITTLKNRNDIDLFDIRHPEDHPSSPNVVHLDKIRTMIDELANNHPDEELHEKTRNKVQIMEERSKIKLTGQTNLNHTFSITVNNHKVVYHDGFAFVGYKKGPVMVDLLEELQTRLNRPNHIPHLIVVDDSKRALDSYIPVLNIFTEKGVKLHILHYPIG